MDAYCGCAHFRSWYIEDGHSVCQCGHRDVEHLDGVGSCVGDVVIERVRENDRGE